MKHISKRITAFILCLVLLTGTMTGCSRDGYVYSYPDLSAYVWQDEKLPTLEGRAADLCVAAGDVFPETGELSSGPYAAGLFSISDQQVLYAKNIHEQLQPASITKLLTALVAFRYGNMDDIVNVSTNILIKEPGAKMCGFVPGDQVTLLQAMYGLLVYSGNDAGVIIAEHISGSVEQFAQLMNEEAHKIGATNTHFVNPHGLTAEGHVTTPYDLYLIFSELMKYPLFLEIIQTRSYTYTRPKTPVVFATDAPASQPAPSETVTEPLAELATESPVSREILVESDTQPVINEQTDSNPVEYVVQVPQTLTWENSNLYFTGEVPMPEGVTILGGKTGTTLAAGACLILLSADAQGKQYISIVMRAPNKPELYKQMTELLQLAGK